MPLPVLTRVTNPARLADVNSELHSKLHSPKEASHVRPTQAEIETDVAAMVEMAQNAGFHEPYEIHFGKHLTGYEMFRAALLSAPSTSQNVRSALADSRSGKHAKGWKSSRSSSRKRASRRAMEHATRKANR